MPNKNISIDDVSNVAKLARLELSTDEKNRFALELSRVFDYIEKIQVIDTKDVSPTFQPVRFKDRDVLDNACRSDKVVPFKNPAGLLEMAPEKEGDYFKVKSILK